MSGVSDIAIENMKVAAILLCAGQSRRMGAFKPLLPFGKETVVQACVSYLVEGGISATDITAVLGHRAEEVRDCLRSSEVEFALNSDPSSEMNVSIATGVRAVSDAFGAVVIALADYPAVPAYVVTNLIKEWKAGFQLVKPTFGGRGGHPVLIDLCFRQELLNLDPNRGLKAIFDEHQQLVRRVEVDSPYIARDVDTWDDYRALYNEIFGVSPPGPDEACSNESPSRLI